MTDMAMTEPPFGPLRSLCNARASVADLRGVSRIEFRKGRVRVAPVGRRVRGHGKLTCQPRTVPAAMKSVAVLPR